MSLTNEEKENILNWLRDELNIRTEEDTEGYGVLFTQELAPMWNDLVNNYCHMSHLSSRKMNSLLAMDNNITNTNAPPPPNTTTTANILSTTITIPSTTTPSATTATTAPANNSNSNNKGDGESVKGDTSKIENLLKKLENIMEDIEQSRQEIDTITDDLTTKTTDMNNCKEKLHNHRLHTGMLLALDNKYNILTDKLSASQEKISGMKLCFSDRQAEKEAGFVTLPAEMQLQYPTGEYKVVYHTT